MFINKIIKYTLLSLAVGLVIASCQKLDQPGFGELILDPPPPPYNPVKAFFAFEENAGDSGEAKPATEAKEITYVDGVNGKAAQIGAGGYIVERSVSDSIKNLGSFTLAFWMNGVGPVVGGAQGLFAIANSNEFWGNLELFLENNDNGDEAFLKIHMFNAAAADGKGEQWNDLKIPDALNKWTHVALTYDSSTSRLILYIDGQPTSLDKVLDDGNYGSIRFKDVSGMAVGTYAFQTSPSLTTHGPEDWARSFNGALDQLRLYKLTLSAAEVNNLYTTKE